jgi:hypothetical protein
MRTIWLWYSPGTLRFSNSVVVTERLKRGLMSQGMDGLCSYEYFCMSVPYRKGVLYLLANQNLAATNVSERTLEKLIVYPAKLPWKRRYRPCKP